MSSGRLFQRDGPDPQSLEEACPAHGKVQEHKTTNWPWEAECGRDILKQVVKSSEMLSGAKPAIEARYMRIEEQFKLFASQWEANAQRC